MMVMNAPSSSAIYCVLRKCYITYGEQRSVT
jgi:hypothetical protein